MNNELYNGRLGFQMLSGCILLVYRGLIGPGVPFFLAWEFLFLVTSLLMLAPGKRG
jgi:hypothetical protein